MISFKTLNEIEKCKEMFAYDPETADKIAELAEAYGEECIGVCRFLGQVLLRVFDGEEYYFLCPRGDIPQAARAIREYAVKEEIGLVFKETHSEDLSLLCSEFLYYDVRLSDPSARLFTVRVKSECDLITAPPSVSESGVRLCALKKKDIPEYGRLCREESALTYWGYDYRDDGADGSDEYFYRTQLAELERGVSLTLAVRWGGRLIGEACLYAFDYVGGAEISFRLLPEYRGKGLGRATLESLFAVAEEVGVLTLYATVDSRNAVSLSLLSQYMDRLGEENGRVKFILSGE